MKSLKILLIILFFNTSSFLLGQQNSISSTTTLFLTGQDSSTLVGEEYQLLKEVAIAFEKMKAAALKDSVNIKIVSSYRSYERQLTIWNRKFKKNETLGMTPEQNIKKITEYSTIPGTSRHHWGTEIDIVTVDPPVDGDVLLTHLFEENGPYSPLKKWMNIHAESFGFHLVYTNNEERKGFQYEPWHYSYKPLSKKFIKLYKNIELKKNLENKEIHGNQYLTDQFIEYYFENYILGISPILQ